MGASKPVTLKIALGTAAHTVDVKSGRVPIEGVNAQFIEVHPIIGAFRRMVRDLEFDVCEMAPTTYMIARSRGAPFIALPIFLHRLFHHQGIVCRAGSGIEVPKDLEGKRVGVRAYSVTTGVWKRGIMAEDFGLDGAQVTWVVDDEEAVPDLPLPANVVRAPAGQSLVGLWSAGELDAAFTGPAGIGRQGPPSAGWNVSAAAASQSTDSYELFTEPFKRAAAFYDRTKIYPHHGLLVVKDAVLSEHPWVARSLFDAMVAAKKPLLAQLQPKPANAAAATAAAAADAEIERYRRLATVVGNDPLPYGVELNLPSINALAAYAVAQGLLPELPSLQQMFVALD